MTGRSSQRPSRLLAREGASRALARVAALLLLVGAAQAMVGCSEGVSRDAGSEQHPNVIWVSIEGAPASLLQGPAVDAHLSKLVATSTHSVVFERALSASDQQPYAQAAALTSCYPSEIAPLLRDQFKLEADLVRLPRVLGLYGYTTAAVWAESKGRLDSSLEYDFGYEGYEACCGSLRHQVPLVDAWVGRSQGSRAADGARAPLFAYIQALDCSPQADARPLPGPDRARGLAAEARACEGLNSLLERLEARGITSHNTLFIVSSPYGRGGAHHLATGRTGALARSAGQAPSSEATSWLDSVHVPLVLWGAGVPASLHGQHVQALCSTLDLLPTILAATHIVVPAQSRGVALLEPATLASSVPPSLSSSSSAAPQGATVQTRSRGRRRAVVCEGETWVACVDDRSLAWYVRGMPAGSPRLLSSLRAASRPASVQPPTWSTVHWKSGSASLAAVELASVTPPCFASLRAALVAVEQTSFVNQAAARKAPLDPALRESLRKQGYW